MSNHGMSGVSRRRRKQSLLLRDGNCCYHCGYAFTVHQLTIEHLVPHSQGGSNKLANLRLACWQCNNQRGSSPLMAK